MMSFISVLTACIAKRYLIAPWMSSGCIPRQIGRFDASLRTQNFNSFVNHRSCVWRTKYQRAGEDVYSRNVICSREADADTTFGFERDYGGDHVANFEVE
jgi:hypothetical protein